MEEKSMGLFDLFKKKQTAALPAEEEKTSATQEELNNQARKSYFYKFAFSFFPAAVFERTEGMISSFARGQQQTLNNFMSMFNELDAHLAQSDITRCKFSHAEHFNGNKSAIIVSFPDTDAPTGNLHPVFGPYYAAVVYSPENLNEAQYFVLCQSFGGKTSFREVNAKGMNVNCGPGPAGNVSEEEFLEALEKLLA